MLGGIIPEPTTITMIAKIAFQVLTDEENRKKVGNIIIVAIIAFVLVLVLPFYLLTHSLEVFGMMMGANELNYIESFQNEYGYYNDDVLIDISGEYLESEIPLFIQWDKRWNMYPYGNSTIGQGGCGTTSMAMVVVGMTSDLSVNPKTMADFSVRNGYRVDGVGTSWGLFTTGAKSFGLNGVQININRKAITEALRAGNPIIASMGPGHFTKGGHLIVLRGITEDGKILINDPNSYKTSEKEWDIGILINESKAMWSFEIAE